jgi:hypothetical protein
VFQRGSVRGVLSSVGESEGVCMLGLLPGDAAITGRY